MGDPNAYGGNLTTTKLKAGITTGLMPALSREIKRQREIECRLSFKLEGKKENDDKEEGEKENQLGKKSRVSLERENDDEKEK